jgi:hypothetical protein
MQPGGRPGVFLVRAAAAPPGGTPAGFVEEDQMKVRPVPAAAVAAAAVAVAGLGAGALLGGGGSRVVASPTAGTPPATSSATTSSAAPTSSSPARSSTASPAGSRPATATPTAPATAATTATATAATAATPWDVDGDGRADRVAVRRTPAGGWEVALTPSSTGELLTSPLLREWVVDDPAVAGSADLERDGHAEVLLRTFHGATGDGYLAVRWTRQTGLVVFAGEAPWELSTVGSMSGPRSFACLDALPGHPGREVVTVESARQGPVSQEPTYTGAVTTWGFDAHDRATALARKPFSEVSTPELGSLFQGGPDTCGIDWR